MLSEADWRSVGSDLSPAETAALDSAKSRARADLALSAWMRQGWAWAAGALQPPPAGARGGPGLPIEEAAALSVADFCARYEQPHAPRLGAAGLGLGELQ
jgi:hypothetical protein